VVIEALARDVTAARALENELQKTIEELRARNAELASLDKLKSQILANVSHELRTPLVSIKGYNELILSGSLGPLTPRQRRGLEIAGGNTDRLVELIETLLDFARREEGRLVLHRAPTDVAIALRDAIGQLTRRIGARGLELDVSLGDEPLDVDGDLPRLTQLFKELVGNAEKFTAVGTIRVRARRDPDQVVVTVEDTGLGIPAAAQARIFDRFYQVDASSTRRFGGAGLGLALVKEIATLHGGEVTVESVERKGSTFTVRLPAAPRHRTPLPRTEQPVVLIGAPDPAWRELKQRLELEGFAILPAAESAAEVSRRARRHRPDAVVLAFPVGEAGGVTAEARALLRRETDTQTIPVLAMVPAEQRPAIMTRADYVVGPDQVSQLAVAVRRLLAGQSKGPRPGVVRQRVVVADDEPENLDFARFILEREGYEVVCVATGDDALAQVDERTNLVILDVTMKILDGIEVCRRLKARPGIDRIPVLMLTATTDDHVRRSSFAAGAAGFLVKPFGVDEFLRQVRLHVRGQTLTAIPAVPRPPTKKGRAENS
jgi:CheY-like chemotaxis protein/nitrogen-specific signal transduction histidine kinase